MQGAQGKRREMERQCQEGRVSQSESAEVGKRADTLSYALLAEINTFHTEKQQDLKIAHQKFLQEQIQFYQKVSFTLIWSFFPQTC